MVNFNNLNTFTELSLKSLNWDKMTRKLSVLFRTL